MDMDSVTATEYDYIQYNFVDVFFSVHDTIRPISVVGTYRNPYTVQHKSVTKTD